MRGLRRSAIALTTLVAALSSAQDVKVDKYQLPNGMTVILHEDHSVPLATINIWYRVGSKDEMPRRSGFAHLFEHLMFMGTKRAPNGMFDQIMEAGGGSNNATTAEDRTNYFSSGPSNILPTLLWLDADRLEALGANMTVEKLDLQRDVVKNERRERTENAPYGRAYEAISSIMFPGDHPYGHSVIGSMQDLSDATLQDVKDFFSSYYAPNNASLVVAGDFDPKVIKPLIAQWYGTLPRRDDPPRPFASQTKLNGVIRRTMTDQVQSTKLMMVWHSPAAYQSGDIAMTLAAQALTNGLGSRLYDRLVVQDKLVTEIGAFQDSKLLGSLFYIDATLAEGADAKKVEAILDEELTAFKKEGPKAADLKRIVAQREFSALSDLQSIDSKADRLNEYEFFFGEPNSFKRVLDMYRNTTPAMVRDEARKVLDLDRRLVMTVVPNSVEEEQATNPRDDMPKFGNPAAFNPPAPKVFSLSNGLKVQYFQRADLPLMALNLQLKGGADTDPADKLGRARMTAAMLDEGAGKLNAEKFQSALDEIGASFGATADEQTTTVGLSVLASQFEKGLGLYADAILRPQFDAEAFGRVQRLSLANLEQENDDPNTVALKELYRAYFGENHPYGTPAQGTTTTVKALSVADLKSEHTLQFRPELGTLFVAGSLDEATVKVSLEKALGGWKAAGPTPTAVTYPAVPEHELQAIVLDRPGAVQTVIRFIMPAPAYQDPNREQYLSLGTILGGSFTSRLNQNLREAKGYTYGAGARYVFTPKFGYMVASSSVRADVTGASLKEFFAEFNRLSAGDVAEEDASKAASILRTNVVESMASLDGLLGVAAGYQLQGLPFGTVAEDLAKLGKIQAAGLNSLAKSAIPVQKGLLILVGDKATILKQLAELEPKLKIVVREGDK